MARRRSPRRAHHPLGQQLAGDEARPPGARPVDVPDGLPPGGRRRPPRLGPRGRTQPACAARRAVAARPDRSLQHHRVAHLLGVRAHAGPRGAGGDHRLHDAALDRHLRAPPDRRAHHPVPAGGARPRALRDGRPRDPRPGRHSGGAGRGPPGARRGGVLGDRHRADQGAPLDGPHGGPDRLAAPPRGRADRARRRDPVVRSRRRLARRSRRASRPPPSSAPRTPRSWA